MSDTHPDTTLLEDEGAGYLVSVSDMMAGLLFVFVITLAAFVINFQLATDRQEAKAKEAEQQLTEARKARLDAEAQRDAALKAQQQAQQQRDAAEREKKRLAGVRDGLTNANRLRRDLLLDIRRRLVERGIRVEVDAEHGVLRLTEQAISFRSGRAELSRAEQAKMARIAEVLIEVLPCYAAGGAGGCSAETVGKLEAVFIEGHTDNVPLQAGRYRDNWDLSAERAMYTYRVFSGVQPGLQQLQNDLGQPLFSVSGYGDGRPVVKHVQPIDEPRNRRIDMRFIMTPPNSSDDPEPVRSLREKGVR